MLSGLPVLSRCEGSINNDFGAGSPPGVPADGFSARYEGRVAFDAADYEFALTGDDGVRLWVDGDPVIDRWVDQAATTYRATRAMTAGVHDVRVESYEASGEAVVRLAITKQVGPPPPPPPPPPPGTVTLQQVDGGLGYFGQFSNSFPTSPDYFMIASWCRPAFDQAQHFDDYKDFGLNTLICVENPELTNEAMIRANGFKTIIQAGERTRFNDLGSETAGWHVTDEIDMTQDGENKCPAALDQAKRDMAVPSDRRLVHNNYGKGVGIWSSIGLGQWTDAKAACYVNYQDLTSIDTYWFTDENESSHRQFEHGWGYGQDVARLRYLDGLDGVRKPQFAWVELGPAGYGAHRSILPMEIRSAVWHALIAGARAVAYFDHNFGLSCRGSTIRGECYPENRAMAQAVNQQVKDLAPVLNSPFVTAGHLISGAPTRRMVKWHAATGKVYVFLATENGGSATFSMPCIGNATAVRLAPSNLPGEGASIPVNNGSFTDAFADKNAVHIYRIDGGSTCGLTAG
jgi:hypothetical protein